MAHKVPQDNVSKNRLRIIQNYDLNGSPNGFPKKISKPVNHPNLDFRSLDVVDNLKL